MFASLIWEGGSGWIVQNWRRIAIGGVVAAALIAAGVTFSTIWQPAPVDRGVVAEWNDAISRLGIDPVFPPEEDIYVGDLLAVITTDRRPQTGETKDQPFLNRAIKIAHLDMRDELEATYSKLPTFPETGTRPKTSDEPWVMSPSTDLFAPANKRPYLAIAAFPGFSIQHQQVAEGGFSGWGAALFGTSREESDLVEVKIPFAETYGVPSIVAIGKLEQFCAGEGANICTDELLRQHLGYVTGQLNAVEVNPKDGKLHYLVDVELALVNRVYLTRSIDQVRTLGRGQAARLQAKGDLPLTGEAPAADTPAPVQTPKAVPEQRLLELNQKVDHLAERLQTDIASGAGSVSVDAQSRYSLKQTFQRPVVIGYRAVRAAFPVTFDSDGTAPEAGENDETPVPGAEE